MVVMGGVVWACEAEGAQGWFKGVVCVVSGEKVCASGGLEREGYAA